MRVPGDTRGSPRPRRILTLLAGVLAAALVAGPATATNPDGSTPEPQRQDLLRPFGLALHEPGDYVAQTNFVQCVGASMQMMLNMIEPGADRTAREQLRLQNLARAWSGRRPDGITRQGASVRGWAAGLNIEGAGPYRLVGERTLEDALRTAARAIRETGRPVGLLVWRGRHAWVMSGFRATADPALTDDFEVTRAIILDPLYPHGSSVWGPSPRPGAALTPDQLGRQFVPRRSNRNNPWASVNRWSTLGGKYVIVLPYEPDHTPKLSTLL
ncbi:MAG TPA: hypothetical protein VFK54_12465 [Candidatus Limnocylindrales bacterium]|nr:hypothetical protein [Candidatus Limnocylindrales bacterium]